MIGIITTEVGHTERDGNAVSPRVIAYMKAAGISWPEDQQPPYWGGALLAWAAIRQGLTPPPNAIDPDSWLTWGHPRSMPESGAIVILTGRTHQVGTVMRVSGDKVYLIHPVNGQVSTEAVSIDRIIATRWPPSTGLAVASSTAVQEVRITVDQPQIAAQPAQTLIEHMPASLDEETRRLVIQLIERVTRLESAHDALVEEFQAHGHVFKRSDGTPIPHDEIVLRSELQH